jgi:hypothetical protein
LPHDPVEQATLLVVLGNALGLGQSRGEDPYSWAVVIAPTLDRAFARWSSRWSATG